MEQAVIHVDDVHTPEQIAEEVRQCLGASHPFCLGHVMALSLSKSPYIEGGRVSDSDIALARSIVGLPEKTPLQEVHAIITQAMAAAWRGLEIIQPRPQKGPASQMPKMGPEWMADIMAGAAEALPSLTYRQLLWEVPLAMTTHLIAAACRKNGSITKRPDNILAALKMLRESQESFNKNQ